MSLLDEEDVLLTNADKFIKIDLTKDWIIKHSSKDSIYESSNYNTLHYQSFYQKNPQNTFPRDIVSLGTFTTVELKWNNGEVILVPKNPNYPFFYKELGDTIPKYINIGKLKLFKIDKYGFVTK